MKRLAFLILMLPVCLTAGEYNLEQLINHGLESSFTVQKNELSAKSTASSLNSAKWNLLPEATVNAGIDKNLDPVAGANDLSSSAGFSLSKTISLNDAAYFNYRYAALDNDTAKMQLASNTKDYVFQVFNAYIEALSAQRKQSSLEENLAIQTRVWEQIGRAHV